MAISVVRDEKDFYNEARREVKDDALRKIISEISRMNSGTDLEIASKDLKFISSVTRIVEGVQGHTEGFKHIKVYADDTGAFRSYSIPNESYGHWSFTRRGYTVKDSKITYSLLRSLEENGRDPLEYVTNKMKGISELYEDNYTPCISYEALFRYLDFDNGDSTYYRKPIGFLRGETVFDDLLKPYAKKNSKRNHYRAINCKFGGLTKLDLFSVAEYLSQYVDILNENVVLKANRKEFNKTLCALDIPFNTMTGDKIMIDDKLEISVSEYMPDDWIFAVNKDTNEILTNLISPKKDFRGMAIVKEAGFSKLENLYDLIGAEFRILPEGHFVTGRHQACLLYTGIHGVSNTDGEFTRPLKDDSQSQKIMETLNTHADTIRETWYKDICKVDVK